MKLSDWAEKQGIAYLTAYRWFKGGKLPVKAYQSESGTIIVQDESENSEQPMSNTQNNDVMSLFLKKTVEFSKNSASIEDFAAYILSNFNLKINTVSDNPKYSRNKPKTEDVQNHFKQFIKPKGEKPKPNMFVAPEEAIDALVAKADDLTQKELVEEIQKIGAESIEIGDVPEVQDLMKDLSVALQPQTNTVFQSGLESHVRLYDQVADGVVTRSVDLTPQLNYTGSTNAALGNNLSINSADSSLYMQPQSVMFNSSVPVATGAFKPTQKELEAVKTFEKPRRGRKSHKKLGTQ